MSSLIVRVPTAVVVPDWIAVGLGEIGVREDIRPGQSNKRIEQYHALTAAGEAPDDIAWCASFVGFCLEMAGYRSTKRKSAVSYAAYGRQTVGKFGCILVFGKTDPDAKGSGHVGFSMGQSGNTLFVLGGNQGQIVSIVPRDVRSVVAFRWPE